MRILLGIVIVAVLAVTGGQSAQQPHKRDRTVSVDPISMMATTTDLPADRYDAF